MGIIRKTFAIGFAASAAFSASAGFSSLVGDIASGVEPIPVTTPVATTWDFVVTEGWPEIEDTFTGETNANGRTWTLTGCRVDPTGTAGDDTGYINLYSPGSAAVAPAFRGVVTQVTTMFRPTSAGPTREVSLLASTDGGATFGVVTNYAVPQRQNYESTFVFDTPLDGGDFGVIFCASNSGTAGSILLRRLTLDGTSTHPDEPGLYDWSPLGVSVAAQPNGALSGVVLCLSAGYGYAADADTNGWITGTRLVNGMVEDFGNLDQLNFFAQQAWKAGATIVPMRPLGYQTNEVVIDNVDLSPSLASRVTFGGAWADTALADCHYGLEGEVGYRWAHACPTGTTAWASYRPDIPVAGEYPVYAWARLGTDRVPQLYRVRHAGGVTEVRIDHRQVGNGWVWLGNFWFEKGTGGCVNISNYAPGFEDGAVVADAIRFGNGMGDIARGAAGVSGLERELEASRYWIERQVLDAHGFPDTLYDTDGDDRADDTFAAARMAVQMCRIDDEARWRSVFVSFASGPGETCDLPVLRFPFSSSQSVDVLKSLRGRESLARVALVGTIHHLAADYGGSTVFETVAPDAPVAVAAMNAGYGRATVSWKMPASKVSDPHTGFVVYTSTDGYAFGNPVAVVSAADECSYTFDGLQGGEPYFFRVCAVNAGGESLPSPVAGAGLSDDGATVDILVVDGFHCADADLTPVRRYNRISGQSGLADVALVRPRMINAFDYVKEHGNAIAAAGRAFDSMDSTLVTATDLARHPFADWFVGRESVETETLSYDEQRLIATFIDNRGFIFLSGTDIGRDLGLMGSPTDRAFLRDILHCTFVADDGGTGVVGGNNGTFLKNVSFEFNYTNSLDDVYAAGRAEVFAPVSTGYSAARYGGADGAETAIVAQNNYSDGARFPRTVIAGFPFETIADEDQRNKLMKRILEFFDDNPTSPEWIGERAYTTGVGGMVEIAIKAQVSGWPSPVVTISYTFDDNTGDEVDPSLYTLTADRFIFTVPAVGNYIFTFRAENANGVFEQDVTITGGNAPVWQRVDDILLDFGTNTTVNLFRYVSGYPAPALELDLTRTDADAATYTFDSGTGLLALGPSDTPVTNSFVFVASNSSGSDTVAITNIIQCIDTDGDGIPDWWETEHFGSPTRCNPHLDPDGDWFSNLEEYQLLTDPRDRNSQLIPAYLADASAFVCTNYVDWAFIHGPDRDGTHETEFLLNIDPSTAIPEGAATLKVVDFCFTNKVLHLELASEACDLSQPAEFSGMPVICNGFLTLEFAFDLGAFGTSGGEIIPISVPVSIDATGHAVIDLDFSSEELPAAMFVKPTITVKVFGLPL